jgi:uncharacterized protein YllA (UPF0747 family)
VAALAAPHYRRALDDAGSLERDLRARGAALATAGWDEQIPVRAGCSLLFFHEREARGPRFRLQREDGRWRLAGGADVRALDDGAVGDALARDPLRFSTSALLRPVVQDALLPTAAYVGGPAEVSYFAQLAPVYDGLGVPQPLVVPRARFRVLDAPTRRRLAQLGLGPDEACGPRAELLARLGAGAGAGPDPIALRRAVDERVHPAVDEVTRAAAAASPGVERAAARTRATVERALSRFLDRYARARHERDGVVTARLDRVRRALAPDGVPQERAYGWPSLAARHGARALKALVLERLQRDPFPTTRQELEL